MNGAFSPYIVNCTQTLANTRTLYIKIILSSIDIDVIIPKRFKKINLKLFFSCCKVYYLIGVL